MLFIHDSIANHKIIDYKIKMHYNYMVVISFANDHFECKIPKDYEDYY